MPSKKGFYFFMEKIQEEFLLKGQKKAMNQLPQIANPRWQKLTKEEKEKYEDMARQAKKDGGVMEKTKYTSDGIPLSKIQKQNKELQLKKDEEILDIQEMVRIDNLNEEPIYIISFNYLWHQDLKSCIPREVGIVKYSFQRGIMDVYHTFISTDGIPTGFASKAKESTLNYHGIPFCGFDLEDDNYERILNDIKNIIKSPVAFCRKEYKEANYVCLKWLAKKANCQIPMKLKLYDAVALAIEVRAYFNDPVNLYASANDIFSMSYNDFVNGVRCKFHEEIDNPNCALAASKKISYSLSNICCEPMGIVTTQNHLPAACPEEKSQHPSKESEGLSKTFMSLACGGSPRPSKENEELPRNFPTGFGRGRKRY